MEPIVPSTELTKQLYYNIKTILQDARKVVYQTANHAMVTAYFEIGKAIVEKQGGQEKAEYGKELLHNLSLQLTAEFGKGFTASNLRNMRQFYLLFQNRHALRSELSWTHYRLLMRAENETARNFYEDECVKSG